MSELAATFAPCTFKQYAKARRRAMQLEYRQTAVDCRLFMPDHQLRPEWVQEMVRHAAAGGDIPRSVARTMTDDERYAVNKFGYSFTRYI